jgi:Rho-type GTPase-activating protein 1/2
MFGRDLVEQVHADSKDEERLIPVIVEKCIDAVDTLGEDCLFSSSGQFLTIM